MDLISLLRPDYVFRNAKIVCKYAGQEASDLRLSFLSSLNKLQRYQFKFYRESSSIYLNFGLKEDFNIDLFREMTDGDLHFTWQYNTSEITDITNKTTNALKLIKKLYPEIYNSINTIIGTLLYARKEGFGGGTDSSIIGAIWLGPSLTWNEIDYAERLFHEYVHTCLFLDEMVNTIFADNVNRMASDDALVTSAILKRKRGFDKSFHSAFVAVTLAHFYNKMEIPSKAKYFISSPTRMTIEEIKTKRYFLTDHGNYILNELDRLSNYYAQQIIAKC